MVLYVSSGEFGPAPLTCVVLEDGRLLWRSREFARASLLQVGARTLVLDEDGVLGLVTLSPDGIEVHARAPVLEATSWTPPTLAGNVLYMRDRRSILALDLSTETP